MGDREGLSGEKQKRKGNKIKVKYGTILYDSYRICAYNGQYSAHKDPKST